MKFQKEKKDQYILLRPDAERLDAGAGQDLKAESVLLNAEGFRNIILDCSQITAGDPKGLSAIVLGSHLCRDKGGMFVVASPTPKLLSELQTLDLYHTLHVLPTLTEAVEAIFFNEIESELNSDFD
ncbi:MAG: STAS domain-containing protein [Bacteroidota bacterium]